MARLLAFAGLLGAILLASPAAAIPAPKSEDQLLYDSDVVALVRVLAVTCTAEWVDEQTGETLHGYTADLEVLEAKKGKAGRGDVLQVGFRDIPTGILGPWSVSYYPGEEAWTHLQLNDGGSAYETTWWNAKGELLHPADVTDLPTRVGVTVQAR